MNTWDLPQRRYGNLVSKRKANEEIQIIENWVEYQNKNNMKTDERDKVDKNESSDKDKNLNQADIESLEKKGLVTDEIIQFFM